MFGDSGKTSGNPFVSTFTKLLEPASGMVNGKTRDVPAAPKAPASMLNSTVPPPVAADTPGRHKTLLGA